MVLFKIPWRSYGNWDVDPSKVTGVGDACAWTGCLQLMMRSKRPKNAHTCVLVLPVEMAVNSLAFSWRIRGDPIPGYEDLEASKE